MHAALKPSPGLRLPTEPVRHAATLESLDRWASTLNLWIRAHSIYRRLTLRPARAMERASGFASIALAGSSCLIWPRRIPPLHISNAKRVRSHMAVTTDTHRARYLRSALKLCTISCRTLCPFTPLFSLRYFCCRSSLPLISPTPLAACSSCKDAQQLQGPQARQSQLYRHQLQNDLLPLLSFV